MGLCEPATGMPGAGREAPRVWRITTGGIRLARMANSIVTRAPTRIDFGGGWTDVPPYSDEMGGYVCNIAISRYATVTVTRGGGRLADALEPSLDRSIADAAAKRFRMADAWISVKS